MLKSDKFPREASEKQVIEINKIVSSNKLCYDLKEVIDMLPRELYINGVRGDMFISNTEISYSSIDSNCRHNLLKSFEIPMNGDFYDAAIELLKYFYDVAIELLKYKV